MNRLPILGLILAFVSASGLGPDPDDGFAGEDEDEQAALPQMPQLPAQRGYVLIHNHKQPASPAPAAAVPPPAAVQPPPPPASAHEAAKVARQAARTANTVAKHSKKIIGHSKKALKHALHALHEARVDSKGLKKRQKSQLKKAEAHLREATKKAEYGKLSKLQDGLDAKEEKNEKEQLLKEIAELRKTLKEKNIDDPEIEKALDELEADVKNSKDGEVSDESKAELERLKQLVNSLEAEENEKEKKVAVKKIEEEAAEVDKEESSGLEGEVTPVQEKGIDIDTQMPYGDLEPFGREDTAQELTESSVKESDEMVDQLERAEVAEEKRAVFRALTRLRGAAITSFDGVARSQTGNIDEYNKVHKWRSTHPLHHLADEESDVSKWAFPDNAD